MKLQYFNVNYIYAKELNKKYSQSLLDAIAHKRALLKPMLYRHRYISVTSSGQASTERICIQTRKYHHVYKIKTNTDVNNLTT